jgi:hypothetical protein
LEKFDQSKIDFSQFNFAGAKNFFGNEMSLPVDPRDINNFFRRKVSKHTCRRPDPEILKNFPLPAIVKQTLSPELLVILLNLSYRMSVYAMTVVDAFMASEKHELAKLTFWLIDGGIYSKNLLEAELFE